MIVFSCIMHFIVSTQHSSYYKNDLRLRQDKKLNYNGRYFFEDQGEKRRRSSSYGEYF